MPKEIPKPYIGMPVTFMYGGEYPAVVRSVDQFGEHERVSLSYCTGTEWFREAQVPRDAVLADGGREMRDVTWWPAGFEP